jgi:hypothetical protein
MIPMPVASTATTTKVGISDRVGARQPPERWSRAEVRELAAIDAFVPGSPFPELKYIPGYIVAN